MTPSVRDRKLRQIEELIELWDVQGICLQEVGVNWSELPSQEQMTSWFRHSCHDFLVHMGNNTTEQLGRRRVYATPSHVTQVILAYNTGKQKSKFLGMIYQQQVRYIQKAGLGLSPSDLFKQDIINQIQLWQQCGERILLMINLNEHIITGRLARQLYEIGLDEATQKHWSNTEPHSFIDGTMPIDGIFFSYDIEVTASVQLSFHESVGDHRTMIVDISSRLLIGKDKFKIVRPSARRLISTKSEVAAKYIKYVEKELRQ